MLEKETNNRYLMSNKAQLFPLLGLSTKKYSKFNFLPTSSIDSWLSSDILVKVKGSPHNHIFISCLPADDAAAAAVALLVLLLITF